MVRKSPLAVRALAIGLAVAFLVTLSLIPAGEAGKAPVSGGVGFLGAAPAFADSGDSSQAPPLPPPLPLPEPPDPTEPHP